MLHVGIIGAGRAAQEFHLPGYSDHEATDVVSIADLNHTRRTQISRQYSIPMTYESAQRMLQTENLDIVSICTPPHTHEDFFVEAADLGCDIYCEKPLTTNLEAAERMNSVAQQAGTVTQLGYKLKFYSNFEIVKNLIINKLLGEINKIIAIFYSSTPSIEWYFDPSVSGGGVITDLFPHILDFYLDVFETIPEIERCITKNRHSDTVEDAADIRLAWDDAPLDISVGWTEGKELSQHTVIGDRGWVEFNQKSLRGNIEGADFRFKYGEPPLIDLEIEQLYFASNEDTAIYRERLDDFVSHVLNNNPQTRSPVEQGLKIRKTISDLYTLADS
jgi:predicted dehydrogenase